MSFTKFFDLTGNRYGLLVVQARAENNEHGQTMWICKCDCDNIRIAAGHHLKNGRIKSCGCSKTKPVVGYVGAHCRIRSAKGQASDRLCVDCGALAEQWSYDYSDANELVEDGKRYSLDLSCYQPRCIPCHKSFDSTKDGKR